LEKVQKIKHIRKSVLLPGTAVQSRSALKLAGIERDMLDSRQNESVHYENNKINIRDSHNHIGSVGLHNGSSAAI
jgi:hypothetical protein